MSRETDGPLLEESAPSGAAPLRAPSPHPPDRAARPSWLARLLRPERRRVRRLPITGMAEIDGKTVRVLDIGPGGVRFAGYRGLLDPQDRFAFRLTVQSPPLELRGEAVVAWRQGDTLGAAFYQLAPADRAALDMALAAALSETSR